MTEATKPAEIVSTDPHREFPGESLERASVTPMDLIQLAVGQNADVDKLEKLMNLQIRWEQNEAKKAFVSAMNAFKANPPDIFKNGKVAYDQVAYNYATLDHVCKEITAGLSKQNISHRWKVEQTDVLIKVTCILTHELGHSEETTLVGGADKSGSKNAIQAIGSAITYLERYSLLAATGLAAKNGDNDGQGAPEMETLQLHLDRMTAAENLNTLDRAFKDAFKEAMALKNTQAMLVLANAKDARKKELQKGDNETAA
jgi:ERF superfamily